MQVLPRQQPIQAGIAAARTAGPAAETTIGLTAGTDATRAGEMQRGPGPGRRVRPLFAALWAAAVLVPALGFGLAAWMSWQGVQAEAHDRITSRVDVLREHAGHLFEVQETVLAALEHRMRGLDWGEIASSAELLDFLRALDRSTPSSGLITLAAPDGRVALHSRMAAPGSPGFDASDREWFRRARESGPGGGTVVSEVVRGWLDGTVFFSLSRARQGQEEAGDGGVLAVSLSIAAIGEFYRSIAGSPRDAIGLGRTDGAVLARYPAPPERSGWRVPPDDKLIAAARESPSGRGILRVVSPFDGVERLYAFHRIEGYPVFVAYGLDAAVLREAWRRQLLAPGLGALAAAGLLLWLTGRAQAAARRKAEALAAAAANAQRARDQIAARAETEARLRQNEKLSALGQIAAGIAHDFKNLVQAVDSAARLLDRRAEDPEEVRRITAMTRDAAARGGRIAQRLLDFARHGASGEERFDLAAAVRGVCELLAGTLGAGVRVVCEVPEEGLPRAVGDRGEFETVLVNLGVNARDAMDRGGGTIRIDAALVEIAEAPATGTALAAGNYLRVRVADTGSGMPPEVLARAGEPFFTTKPPGQGTGLGLPMARRFAEQGGGALTIDSVEGEGTTVTLWLRAADAAPVAAA